ncbi:MULTISPECIES: TrbI/VirB10 family protein [Klebsiella pneumoniae complex]|uniref:TrbI/VirB10 family protein n=1 Tax=Klebsiella pneumoniae complex TaxID=3390273 RepID=UPI0006720432|nr:MULTISPECIES: TrbI/VirB10 family protein [Klebsiella]BDT52549.1 conjugal transfer protein [Raoultella planticola]HDS2232388.1 hypothetical protein [Klebsiella pneumoniae subsp. pneumoniae]HDS5296708.1 hypothetical protein [Klebsiella quasipneumoniae subsp. similipneumoniae]MBK3179382.1 hypothetical protein [Klebsiella pneumoniae]MCR3882160.1 hypothetical protein [Klebsiella quasipneumoniae]
MNINKQILNKQRKLLIIIVSAIALAVTALWAINKKASTANTKESEALKSDIPEPEPDLTGAVTNTFNSAVDGNVILDAQMQQQEAAKTLNGVQDQLKELKQSLVDMSSENAELKQQLTAMQQKMTEQPAAPAPQSGMSTGQYQPPRTEYRLNAPSVKTGQVDNATFDYTKVDQRKKKATDSFYVPTGTFSNAIVVEGADASASVRGSENLVPMQFKLTGLAHMPGNQRLDKLANCFVTAAVYGDISSERALPQLQRLSCIINGKHIDQEVKGHVAFYGKNGIKGVPVMRNGKILGLAFAAGALSGLGQSVSQVGQTVAGVGATTSISGGDVARSSIGGGVSSASNKLADYYIERSEQYHPIIPIGAGNRIEVVFIEGFKAETLEDKELAESQKESPQTTSDNADNKSMSATGNSGLPPELLGKLGDADHLKLGDFVTPASSAN